MIGLIKLTAPDGHPYYINPQYINFMTEPCPSLAESLGVKWESIYQKGTLMFCSGVKLQFKETPNEIINALTRLRQRNEKNTIQVLKAKDREDWEGEPEDE